MAQECRWIRQTRRLPASLKRDLPGQGGSRAITGCLFAGIRNRSPSSGGHLVRVFVQSGRSEMLRADLLKPDLLSEFVLLCSGALLLGSLLLIIITVFTQA
jgi:hypothetical protein